MPFKSAKQERYMWANHPAVARRWASKYGSKLKKKSKDESADRKSGR